MSQCSYCGCNVPASENICRKCFDARYADLDHPKSPPERPLPLRRPIAAFVFGFSVVLLVCLLKEWFLGYHKAPIVDTLLALLGGSIAAYNETHRCSRTHRRRS